MQTKAYIWMELYREKRRKYTDLTSEIKNKIYRIYRK